MSDLSPKTPFVGDLQKRFDLVDEIEFAALRGVTVTTLRNERSRGEGPVFHRTGRKVMYPFAAVKAFIEGCAVKPVFAPTLIHGQRRRRAAGAQ